MHVYLKYDKLYLMRVFASSIAKICKANPDGAFSFNIFTTHQTVLRNKLSNNGFGWVMSPNSSDDRTEFMSILKDHDVIPNYGNYTLINNKLKGNLVSMSLPVELLIMHIPDEGVRNGIRQFWSKRGNGDMCMGYGKHAKKRTKQIERTVFKRRVYNEE